MPQSEQIHHRCTQCNGCQKSTNLQYVVYQYLFSCHAHPLHANHRRTHPHVLYFFDHSIGTHKDPYPSNKFAYILRRHKPVLWSVAPTPAPATPAIQLPSDPKGIHVHVSDTRDSKNKHRDYNTYSKKAYSQDVQ